MRILFAPECQSGNGTAHARRAVRLAREVEGVHHIALADGCGQSEAARLIRKETADAGAKLDECVPENQSFDMVVIDRQEVSAKTVQKLLQLAPVVGIDTGGAGRQQCDYLIDTLPRLDSSSPPNVFDVNLLELPVRGGNEASGGARVRSVKEPGERPRVLVSFGGEDRKGLGRRVVRALVQMDLASPEAIIWIDAAHRREPAVVREGNDVVKARPAVPGLTELFSEVDLVITMFGMTAFEASAYGLPVVTVSPTRYHARLSRSVGFYRAGTFRPDRRALRRLFHDGYMRARVELPAGPVPRTLAALLSHLDVRRIAGCPVCHSRKRKYAWRFEEKSYFRCGNCGMLYMEKIAGERISYTRSYFFEEYRKQYGKTYLEDFEHIRRMGADRIRRLNRLGLREGSSLLDVGCAFGPFLKAGKDARLQVYGIDVAEPAVRYVKETLGLPAVKASVEEFSPQRVFNVRQFDAVTMWYVIEHVEDLERVLTRVNRMIANGGYFAFSTPSGSGISSRRDKRSFLSESPDDHVTVWEPGRAGAILRRFGFQLRQTVITGHHPERFPWTAGRKEGSVGWRAARVLSRGLRLGDTFEVYCRKVREL